MAVVFYYDDHDPPHFHVRAPDFVARILIRDGSLIDSNGRITAPEMRALRTWCLRHRAALMDNWQRARRAQPLKKVESEP
jgi:hypothetical protein